MYHYSPNERKAQQRRLLEERLDDALGSLYHAASPFCPDVEGEEAEAFNCWYEQWVEVTLDCLGRACPVPHAEEFIAPESIGLYGRGGRTCSPEAWIRNFHFSGPNMMRNHEDFELTRAELTRFVECVESFRELVVSFCRSIPEQWEAQKNC